MESSTKLNQGEWLAIEKATLMMDEYERLMAGLPIELEKTARETGALVRRREVKRAIDLLRMVFAYSVCDWSLRLVGAWCVLLGIGEMSDVAVRKRLRNCERWLGELLVGMMLMKRIYLTDLVGVRLRLVDATTISHPGSQGTDWRVHLSMDLGHLCIDDVVVTDVKGGERLSYFEMRRGEIIVADRGLASANNIGHVLAAEANFLIRTGWCSLGLQTAECQPFDLIQWLYCVDQASEVQVWLQTPLGRSSLRLLASPLPEEKAAQARQRVRRNAQRKGRTPSEASLFAAGFVILVTNLPASTWNTHLVFQLYRIRWQVELLFKRLKSLLCLDGLRAKDPSLSKVYLMGKLLAALLLDGVTQAATLICPQWFASLDRPVSIWRLTTLFQDAFRSLIRGYVPLIQVIFLLPKLQRYLCLSPRKRRQQLVWARDLLVSSFVC